MRPPLGGVFPAASTSEQISEVTVEGGEVAVGRCLALLRCRSRLLRFHSDRGHDRVWAAVRSAEGRGVGDPALVSVVGPVDGEVVAGLVEVVGDGVEGRACAGAAEGDVGELSSAASGEDVGAVAGGALGAVDGERVAVVEVVGVDRCAVEDDGPSVGVVAWRRDPGTSTAVTVRRSLVTSPSAGTGASSTRWSPVA